MSDKAIMVAAGGLVVSGLLIFWAVQPGAPIMPDGPQVVARARPEVDPDAMPAAQNATAPAQAPAAPTTTAPAPQSQAAKIDTAESNSGGDSKYRQSSDAPSGSKLTYEDERFGASEGDDSGASDSASALNGTRNDSAPAMTEMGNKND